MNNPSRIPQKTPTLHRQQITKNIAKSQLNLIKNFKIRKTDEQIKNTLQNKRVQNFVKRFSCDFKRDLPSEHCFQNKDTISTLDQWHKRSVSMKMKTFNYIQYKKPQKGFYMKFRKNQQIYSFRCFKTDDNNNENIISQKNDNDTITDDEQIYVAQRSLFYQLCCSIQNEILEEEDDQKTQPKESQ